MPVDTLTTVALGPFDGVADTRGASIATPGKLRSAKNMQFQGANQLSVRGGTVVALTLKDDAGTPADVTSVLAVQSFMDGAVAVAHSTATSKVYLYRLPATMDGWYDNTGALQSNATPQPCAVLWTSVTVAPDVWLAEGLGTLYCAQTSAIDEAGLYFATQQVTFSSAGVPTVADLKASGSGGSVGTDTAYFTAIASFHQHLWGIGYGIGSTAGYTSFRPELARFSQPSFGDLQTADSIVIGDRVRALRERVIGLWVAGDALFLGASKYLFRVTGYGRDSWVVETLDEQFGVVGPKAAVAVGHTLYYWSSRGPVRCSDSGSPEPLWDAVVQAVGTVANESKIVAGFDASSDAVLWTYDSGDGVRTLCAFDTRRSQFASVNGDMGLAINCAGVVEPIYQSTVTPPAAPAAPTIVSTTNVLSNSAQCTWSIADSLSKTEVSYRVQGNPSYTVATLADLGVTTFTLTSLASSTPYEWRLRSYKNGIYSAYVGPVTASQFTTAGAVDPGPTPPSGLSATAGGARECTLAWTNGDPSVPTQIFRGTDGTHFSQIATASAGETTYLDHTPSSGTFYYEVRHIDGDGNPSAFSDVASADVA